MKAIFTLKSLMAFSVCFLLAGNAWTQNFTLTVNEPFSVAGDYDAQLGGFGPTFCEISAFSGNLILVDDGTDPVNDGCEAPTNGAELSGNIAVIDRGACAFTQKCLGAQNAGAIAVVVCNNTDDPIITMGGSDPSIMIPCVMISRSDCQQIRAEIPGATATISPNIPVDDSDDTVLWGDNPGEGDFDGGLNGWSTIGLSEMDEVWTWEGDATPNGALFTPVVESPSLCNGIALFDADFYQSGGNIDSLPNPPYPTRSGELISPILDLTGFGATALKFYQYNVPLNGSTTVSYSTDGGMTWSEPLTIGTENILTADVTNLVGTEIVRIFLPGIANQAEARIKFTFTGDFYFWAIDDVKIILPPAHDLRCNPFYAIAPNAMTPASQVEPFGFLADIENIGSATQTNVNLNVTITDDADGSMAYTDDLAYGTIGPDSLAENVPFNNLYTPTTDLTTYSGTYTVSADSTDFDNLNNTQHFSFGVSSDMFAKETGATRTIVPAAANWDDGEPHSWAYGNHFYVTNGAGTTATHAHVGFGNAETVAGRSITVWLYKWTDDNEDGSAQPTERVAVGFNIYEILGTENVLDVIPIPLLGFPDDTQPAMLEDNTHYILMVEYSTFDDIDFALTASEDFDYNAQVFLSEIQGAPRYAGMLGINGDLTVEDYGSIGFGRDLVPVVRLQVSTAAAPVADFSFDADQLNVNFSDLSSNSPTGWSWDFGDGSSSTDQNPSHTYSAGGTYTVCLTATNAFGSSDPVCQDVTVMSTSTEELDPANKVQLSPNPAKDVLFLNLDLLAPAENAGVQIIDVLGKTVFSSDYNNIQTGNLSYDISNLSSGTYFFIFKTEAGNRTQRFVVSK